MTRLSTKQHDKDELTYHQVSTIHKSSGDKVIGYWIGWVYKRRKLVSWCYGADVNFMSNLARGQSQIWYPWADFALSWKRVIECQYELYYHSKPTYTSRKGPKWLVNESRASLRALLLKHWCKVITSLFKILRYSSCPTLWMQECALEYCHQL